MFCIEFKACFKTVDEVVDAKKKLWDLRQYNSTVHEYAIYLKKPQGFQKVESHCSGVSSSLKEVKMLFCTHTLFLFVFPSFRQMTAQLNNPTLNFPSISSEPVVISETWNCQKEACDMFTYDINLWHK